MRVAIAGGNGYIGRGLTRKLVDAGDQVVWLSHRPGRIEELGFEPGRPAEVVFEPHDRDGAWAEEVAAADAVVNLSGYPISSRWNDRTWHLIRESRLDTTRALAEVIADCAHNGSGPSVLVNASAVGVYGDRGDEALAEDSPPGEDKLSRLAREWEAETRPASDAGVRVAIVRTGVVLGEEGFLPRMVLPMQLFFGGPVGPGDQWFSWVHVDDMVGIYGHALTTSSLAGPVNAAPEPIRMKEFAKALGQVLRRPSWLKVPTFGLSIVLGKVAPYMMYSQRAAPKALADSGYEWRFPDLESALRDLL